MFMTTIKNRRFFAYGCSYTDYLWPTWADLLGRNYKEYYNYGHAGAGNLYIFSALMESDYFHNLGKNDLVIIEWSAITREDRYIDDEWKSIDCGEKNFRKYFDLKGHLIRDLSLMKAAKLFLDKINCEYYFISLIPIVIDRETQDLFETDTTGVELLYRDIIDIVKPSFEEVLGAPASRRPICIKQTEIDDGHPIPTEHYDYINKVLPHLLFESREVAEKLNNELGLVYTSKRSEWKHLFPDVAKGKSNIKERL